MPELDDEARGLLAQLRAEEELPPALQATVWGRLEATAPATAATKPAYVWWGVAAAAALVLAFVGLSATTASDGAAEADDHQAVYGADGGRASGQVQPGTRATTPETAPVRPGSNDGNGGAAAGPLEADGDRARPEPPEAVDDTPTPGATVPGDDATMPTAAETKARPRAHDKRPTPAVDDDEPKTPETISLAGEIALLKKMRAALNADDTTRVLELAAEHAKSYPQGALAPERRGLKVIAQCNSGRAGADEAAASFLRAHPGSPLVDRVRTACPNVEKSPTP